MNILELVEAKLKEEGFEGPFDYGCECDGGDPYSWITCKKDGEGVRINLSDPFTTPLDEYYIHGDDELGGEFEKALDLTKK